MTKRNFLSYLYHQILKNGNKKPVDQKVIGITQKKTNFYDFNKKIPPSILQEKKILFRDFRAKSQKIPKKESPCSSSLGGYWAESKYLIAYISTEQNLCQEIMSRVQKQRNREIRN